jgi:ornithine cyclodeaminase/alanine dehydrogenase-like protein (mu-crystallin family)
VITEMRTAAVSAAATRLLSDAEAHVLAILGSGVQARSHFQALKLVRKFDEVRVWSPTPEHAHRFATEVGATRAGTAEDAARGADVVVTATSAEQPVLRGAWLKQGAVVNAIGGIGPTSRELDDDCMRGSIVVESRESAIHESGDVILSGAAIYAELGELLAGAKPLPTASPIIFKSLGIAVEDIATAELVYRKSGTVNRIRPTRK